MAMTSKAKGMMQGGRRLWEGLSTVHRMALGTLVIFIVVAAAYVSWLGSEQEWATAFSGLSDQDAAAVVAMLDEKKIPYLLSSGGGTIQVPPEQQHAVRLMAVGGGALGGQGGYELFDAPRFGMTPFEMKMNYRRALEGELRRTIASLEEVQDARVHLVLPHKATFTEDDQEATASVVLTLKRGSSLSKDKAHGIVNLVSASVEGLSPERITVVDQSGKTLTAPTDPLVAGSMNAMEARSRIERQHETRLLELLEPALGGGNVRVRVTAEVDFRKVERVDETWDPKVVPRSRQVRTENRPQANAQAEGVPGARSNVAGEGQSAGEIGQGQVGTTSESVNYEVSSKVMRTDESGESLRRLSVAVLLNGTWTGEGEQRQYVPRSEEEMARIEGLVKGSVGFDGERGDAVVISNMPFQAIETPLEDAPEMVIPPDVWRGARYGAAALLVLALLVLVVRPLVKAVTLAAPEAVGELTPAGRLAGTEPPAERAQVDQSDVDGAMSPRLIAMEYATEHPRKAAQILRGWLLEDGAGAQGQTLAEMVQEARTKEPSSRAG